MKYLCLIYGDESGGARMTKEEGEAMMADYFAFTDGIKKSGHYVGGEALKPTHTASTVRVRQGKISTTDGPFAETKEQLLGFYVMDFPSLDEAVAAAQALNRVNPSAVYEIRPIELYLPGKPVTGHVP